MRRIAIIGGGAAGMMAAAAIAEYNLDGGVVTVQADLYERNAALGAKVVISGGGRCNVTTGTTDMRQLLGRYPRGGAWLRSALRAFGPARIRAWFEAHGVPLKEEADGRVFPVSNNGHDIVNVFTRLLSAPGSGVRVLTGHTVTDIAHADGHITVGVRQGDVASSAVYDAIIITTGGNAYAQTGSRGDGYAFARSVGHTITPLGPSLNSFHTAQRWMHALSGISFADALLRATTPDGAVEVRGPVILTHFGVSGPAVFAFAAQVPYVPLGRGPTLHAALRVQADRDAAAWDALLAAAFADGGARAVRTVLRTHLPERCADAVLDRCGVAPDRKAAEVSRTDRQKVARLLGDGVPLTLTARRAGDEFVTAGGVATTEVDARTGQSRLVPEVYFAGEVLDVDGVTGGYNLTASWAVGRAAGTAAVRALTA